MPLYGNGGFEHLLLMVVTGEHRASEWGWITFVVHLLPFVNSSLRHRWSATAGRQAAELKSSSADSVEMVYRGDISRGDLCPPSSEQKQDFYFWRLETDRL